MVTQKKERQEVVGRLEGARNNVPAGLDYRVLGGQGTRGTALCFFLLGVSGIDCVRKE